MARKKKNTTRRSVSVRGLTYQRARKVARALFEEQVVESPSVSGLFEWLLDQAAESCGIPPETVLEPRKPSNRERPCDVDVAASGIFSF